MKTFNKRFVYFICVVSAMGGLLFGYDWVVIGGAKPFYEVFFDIADSPKMQGLAMSIALVGCLIGAMTAGSHRRQARCYTDSNAAEEPRREKQAELAEVTRAESRHEERD